MYKEIIVAGHVLIVMGLATMDVPKRIPGKGIIIDAYTPEYPDIILQLDHIPKNPTPQGPPKVNYANVGPTLIVEAASFPSISE
jgi:hypothetical protein